MYRQCLCSWPVVLSFLFLSAGVGPALSAQAESGKSGRASDPAVSRGGAASRPARSSLAWRQPGSWIAVAADAEDGTVHALSADGKVAQFDRAGKPLREATLGSPSKLLRLGKLKQAGGSQMLSFSTWATDLRVYDTDGSLLWSVPKGMGIDDVWACDLNGDGLSEVIVGYNGLTGLQVFDAKGKPVWKYGKISNVWHVCAGDIDDDKKPEVVTTSAAGMIHVFSAAGKKVKDIDAGCYATSVGLVRPRPVDRMMQIVAAGSKQEGKEVLVLLDLAAGQQWSVDLASPEEGIASLSVCRSNPWVAVGLKSGRVKLIDVGKRRSIIEWQGQGRSPQVAWSEDKKSAPLLLIATGRVVYASRILE